MLVFFHAFTLPFFFFFFVTFIVFIYSFFWGRGFFFNVCALCFSCFLYFWSSFFFVGNFFVNACLFPFSLFSLGSFFVFLFYVFRRELFFYISFFFLYYLPPIMLTWTLKTNTFSLLATPLHTNTQVALSSRPFPHYGPHREPI